MATRCVPSDVIENLLGTCEGRFRVDHPFLLPQRVEIPVEGLPLALDLEGGEELELAALEGLTEQFQEAPTEEAREHPHGQEEPGPAGDPALTVRGEPAARHHAMQVRVVHQVLPPGMEDGEEADLGAEVPGIGGNGAQRLGGGGEEQIVDHRLVLVGDGGDLLREREDDVEVGAIQELGFAILDPLRPGE